MIRPVADVVLVEVVAVVADLAPEGGGHGEHSGEEPDQRDVDGVRPRPGGNKELNNMMTQVLKTFTSSNLLAIGLHPKCNFLLHLAAAQ